MRNTCITHRQNTYIHEAVTTAFQFGGDHRCTVWRWRPPLHSLAVTIASQQLGGGDRYSISSCFLFGFKSGCFREKHDLSIFSACLVSCAGEVCLNFYCKCYLMAVAIASTSHMAVAIASQSGGDYRFPQDGGDNRIIIISNRLHLSIFHVAISVSRFGGCP